MRLELKAVVMAGVVLSTVLGPGGVGRGSAQVEIKPTRSARGGLIAKADTYQFEVFFYTTGVRIFPWDGAGAAVDASRLAGTATFYHPNSPKPWFGRPLRGTPASLDLAIGLSDAPRSGAKVAFEITGLSGAAKSRTTFTLPLEFVTQPTAPQGEVPIVPRYVYGLGDQGYGYYPYTSPATEARSSVRQSYMSSIPGMYGPGGMTVGPGHRDWTTGRDSPLAKPWLRARD